MTYAGAYGRNERVPVDRMLRREGHPLGVRRAEATKAATAEERDEREDSLSRKRWTLSVATGALLVAGTFAGALGLHGGATNTAGSAPEHAPASPGHTPGSGPVIGAPVPGQDRGDQQQQPQPKNQPTQQQSQPTTPASAGTHQGVPVAGGSGTGGTDQTGGTQRSGGGTSGGTSTQTQQPAPQPAPEQQAPPAQQQQQQGPVGGLLGTVGGVLSPVTGAVGGLLSTDSAQTDSTASARTAPSGPALAMIDPLGGLLG